MEKREGATLPAFLYWSMQVAWSKTSTGKSSCRLHGVKTLSGKVYAGCMEQKLCREKFMQVAWSKNSVGKSLCRLHGVKTLSGKVHAGCMEQNVYREKFMQAYLQVF